MFVIETLCFILRQLKFRILCLLSFVFLLRLYYSYDSFRCCEFITFCFLSWHYYSCLLSIPLDLPCSFLRGRFVLSSVLFWFWLSVCPIIFIATWVYLCLISNQFPENKESCIIIKSLAAMSLFVAAYFAQSQHIQYCTLPFMFPQQNGEVEL